MEGIGINVTEVYSYIWAFLKRFFNALEAFQRIEIKMDGGWGKRRWIHYC